MKIKTIKTFRTYDPTDSGSCGYYIQIRDNGTMRLTNQVCWVGCSTGQIYISPIPKEIMDCIENPDNLDVDMDTVVVNYFKSIGSCGSTEWEKIYDGRLIT